MARPFALLLLCIWMAPAASASPTAWEVTSHPSTGMTGCLRGDWLDGVAYVVRTPKCSLVPGQAITLERYDPATGELAVLAALPSEAAQATARAIDGEIYVFAPDHGGTSKVPVHKWDEACGCLVKRLTTFPGCFVDHAAFVVGTTITWVSSCVWACSFVRYDTATDKWTVLPASLPSTHDIEMGLVWDGATARILTYSSSLDEHRFFDYDPATGALAAGPTVTPPGYGLGSPLVQAGERGAYALASLGGSKVRAVHLDTATGTWTALTDGFPAKAGFVDGMGDALWRMAFDGTVERIGAPLPAAGPSPPATLPPAPTLPPLPPTPPIPPTPDPSHLVGLGTQEAARRVLDAMLA